MKQKEKVKKVNNDKIDLIIGIVVILATMALFIWLIAGLTTNSRGFGSIKTDGEVHRGVEQTFTFDTTNNKMPKGTKVTWYANGQKIQTDDYNGQPLQLKYTPNNVGSLKITAKTNKQKCYCKIDVLPPQLCFAAQNVTITYGDKLPNLAFNCKGFVDGDTLENVCYDGTCCVKNTKLKVGTYPIEFDKKCGYKDYDVQFKAGTLTVLPKTVCVTGNLCKVYDQTCALKNPTLKLVGVVDGDDVRVECKMLYFSDKNVGKQKAISTSNMKLVGKDSKNYVLCDTIYGCITPKPLTLEGLTVANKSYDGTNKATIEKMGILKGILPNDNVAIGKIDVSFDSSQKGTRTARVTDILLVGLDKNNYTIQEIAVKGAKIG